MKVEPKPCCVICDSVDMTGGMARERLAVIAYAWGAENERDPATTHARRLCAPHARTIAVLLRGLLASRQREAAAAAEVQG